jgi:hypothetical protein
MRPHVGASITLHTRGDNKNARLLDEWRYEPGGDLLGERRRPTSRSGSDSAPARPSTRVGTASSR